MTTRSNGPLTPGLLEGSSFVLMTDDIEGRLDLESHQAPEAVAPAAAAPSYSFYEAEDAATAVEPAPPPIPVSVTIAFEDGDTVALEGVLANVSFGKGWLASVVADDGTDVAHIVLEAAKHKLERVVVKLGYGAIKLTGNVDCSLTIGHDGARAFTVAADEGSYV